MTLALLLTAATGAWAQDPNAVTAAEINSDLYSGWSSIDGKLLKASELPGFQAVTENQAKSWTGVPSTGKVKLFYEFVADGHVKVVIFMNGVYDSSYEENDLRCYDIYEDIAYNGDTKYFYTTGPAPSGPAVTINEAKTEASFKMPQYDVTATYTLKRDLSVETQVTVGDDHDAQPRYRVQKQGNTFQPVGMDQAQVMALFRVHDQIEDQDLAAVQDYTVQIYAVDIEGQPTGDAITFQNFTYAPGQYIVKAQGQGNYTGQTTESNIFTLYQGYEIVVAANEYATYYKDEALYIEDEDAQLYTITSVTDTEAVLSERSDAMPSNTPMLVYNKSNETKTILLIPCAEPDMDITVAPEFKGTLTGTTIAASTDAQTNYAFNGKQFVWVKDALEVGPNKAWLEVPTGDFAAGARAINLVFGETTKITTTNLTNITNGDWYDLNGRKLQGIPTKKGIYIMNGRKVVVK